MYSRKFSFRWIFVIQSILLFLMSKMVVSVPLTLHSKCVVVAYSKLERWRHTMKIAKCRYISYPHRIDLKNWCRPTLPMKGIEHDSKVRGQLYITLNLKNTTLINPRPFLKENNRSVWQCTIFCSDLGSVISRKMFSYFLKIFSVFFWSCSLFIFKLSLRYPRSELRETV